MENPLHIWDPRDRRVLFGDRDRCVHAVVKIVGEDVRYYVVDLTGLPGLDRDEVAIRAPLDDPRVLYWLRIMRGNEGNVVIAVDATWSDGAVIHTDTVGLAASSRGAKEPGPVTFDDHNECDSRVMDVALPVMIDHALGVAGADIGEVPAFRHRPGRGRPGAADPSGGPPLRSGRASVPAVTDYQPLLRPMRVSNRSV